MADVVQVTTRIDGSVVEVAFVDGHHVLDWAPVRVDGFVAHVDGVAHTVTASPLHARVGIADVTFVRVPRPARGVPYAPADHAPARYLVGSLALHLLVFSTAIALGPTGGDSGAPVAFPRHIHIGGAAELAEQEDAPRVSMHLDDLTPAKRGQRGRGDGTAHAEGRLAAPGGVSAALAPDLADVIDIAGAMDGVGPAFVDEGRDGFGSGSRAFGRGAGEGIIAADGYGTTGGVDENMFGVRARGVAREHVAGLPTVYMCARPDGRSPSQCVNVVGDLDKALIRRYLRRHLPEIQHCYEQALLVDPTLEGTVDTEFKILAEGRVVDPRAAGVSTSITSCVVDVLSSIQFPRSVGGGTTVVHYPFTFRVAG